MRLTSLRYIGFVLILSTVLLGASSVVFAEDRPVTCNRFTFDARESYDLNDKTADRITYVWDFGDGNTSEEAVVTHTYQKPGTYTVNLEVSNHKGTECDTAETSQVVEVRVPPYAFYEAKTNHCVGEEIVLEAKEKNNGANFRYSWDFGDGTKAEGKRVTKTYNKGGAYDVWLTVDDLSGSPCSVARSSRVLYINTLPQANATVIDQGDGYTLNYDGTSSSDPDGDPLQYRWNFGDGASSTQAQGMHRYANGGDYDATLTVDDGKGTTCSQTTKSLPLHIKPIVQRKYYDKQYFDKNNSRKPQRKYYDKQYFGK